MNTHEIPIVVVGLGLMGCSITSCLLIVGHTVVAVAPVPDDLKFAEGRVREHFKRSQKKGYLRNYYRCHILPMMAFIRLWKYSAVLYGPVIIIAELWWTTKGN